jgi:hypothetical protein
MVIVRLLLGENHRLRGWLAVKGPPDRVMIDSTHLKAHRTAASLLKRGIHPVSSAARKAG